MVHDSQIVRAKENLKLSYSGPSQRQASGANQRIKATVVQDRFWQILNMFDLWILGRILNQIHSPKATKHTRLVHFIVTCEKLEEVRQPFISKLETLITSHHGSHWWNQLGDRDMVQLLLDNTKLIEINEPTRLQIWDISRGLCYKLHSKRSAILNML